MSLRLLDSLSLFPLVFNVPSTIVLSAQPASTSLAIAAASILRTFLQPDSALFQLPPVHPLILSGLSSSTSVVPRLYMACALTPYRGITYVDDKSKEHSAVEVVIHEGLKVGTKNHYLDGIPALFAASGLFKPLDVQDEKKTPSERVAIGPCWSSLSLSTNVLVKGYSSVITLYIMRRLARTGRHHYCFLLSKNL
jgi:tRNA nucleotidyltransferase (CCA-adding enzyme)